MIEIIEITDKKGPSTCHCNSRLITIRNRDHHRFFDRVGHETMYASSGNKHFFTKSCQCQTYQNNEQRRQKLGTI